MTETAASTTLLKKQILKYLGREPEVEKLKGGKFLCKYVEYGVSNLALVGETEIEAYQKLLTYLQNKKKERDSEPEPPMAA